MRAPQVRSATIVGEALTDEESDALELELPVNIPGVKLSEARGGAIAAGASTAFDMTFPPKAQPGSRLLSIRVSPSIAGGLFELMLHHALQRRVHEQMGQVMGRAALLCGRFCANHAKRQDGFRRRLLEHTRFGAEVTGARWDERTGTWAVTEADGTRHVARALVSAIAVQTRARDLTGPLIGLPLLIPALIATARAAGPLFVVHGSSSPPGKWLAVLALYDVVFALLAYALFDFLLED